jgi:hypothetical protein
MCAVLDLFAGALLTVGGGVAGYAVCAYLRCDDWLCVQCGQNPVASRRAVCETCFDRGGPR